MSEQRLDAKIGFKSGAVVQVNVSQKSAEVLVDLAIDQTATGYFDHSSGLLYIAPGSIAFADFTKEVVV